MPVIAISLITYGIVEFLLFAIYTIVFLTNNDFIFETYRMKFFNAQLEDLADYTFIFSPFGGKLLKTEFEDLEFSFIGKILRIITWIVVFMIPCVLSLIFGFIIWSIYQCIMHIMYKK